MYTIERFNGFLEHLEVKNVNGLLLEGAKDYYSMVRRIREDYITKAFIASDIDASFDQFAQQINAAEYIEAFAREEGIEEEAVYFAIDQRIEEFVTFLLTKVDEIAKFANEEDE